MDFPLKNNSHPPGTVAAIGIYHQKSPNPQHYRSQLTRRSGERESLALPTHLEGLGIVNPTLTAQVEYETSIRMTEPLVHKIINQEETLQDVISQVIQRERRIHQHRRSVQNVSAANLKSELPSHLSRAMELASEKGLQVG